MLPPFRERRLDRPLSLIDCLGLRGDERIGWREAELGANSGDEFGSVNGDTTGTRPPSRCDIMNHDVERFTQRNAQTALREQTLWRLETILYVIGPVTTLPAQPADDSEANR